MKVPGSCARAFILIVALRFWVPEARASFLWNTYGSGYAQAYLSEPRHEKTQNFVLGAPAQITAANWTGVYVSNSAPADNFYVEIFADIGGQPGTTAQALMTGTVVRTDTGTRLFGFYDLYNYSMTPSTPLVLGAGTYYFEPVDSLSTDGFYWAAVSTDTGSIWVRDNFNPPAAPEPWQQNTSTMAFSLEGASVAVPSPSWGGPVLLAGTVGLRLVGRPPVMRSVRGRRLE
ncbi:MAG: hypothetical protein JWL69_3455 [Phycisphaerales bacterium]|nr:hypothetical protein [Phycisphaerales bacterium]